MLSLVDSTNYLINEVIVNHICASHTWRSFKSTELLFIALDHPKASYLSFGVGLTCNCLSTTSIGQFSSVSITQHGLTASCISGIQAQPRMEHWPATQVWTVQHCFSCSLFLPSQEHMTTTFTCRPDSESGFFLSWGAYDLLSVSWGINGTCECSPKKRGLVGLPITQTRLLTLLMIASDPIRSCYTIFLLIETSSLWYNICTR